MIIGEGDDENLANQNLFPKKIFDAENIADNVVENKGKVKLSTREILTFFIFCGLFVFVLFNQLHVQNNFRINEVIMDYINSFDRTFDDIGTAEDLVLWNELFINKITEDSYYQDFPKEEGRQVTIQNANLIISPIRYTTRRIKLKESPYKDFVNFTPLVWVSSGFDCFDNPNDDEETTSYNEWTYSATGGIIYPSKNK
jgi:hypothetical protein